MSNNITKTIMESLSEWKNNKKYIVVTKEIEGETVVDISASDKFREDFFLQSQIKVIEAVIEMLQSDKYNDPSLQLLIEDRHFEESYNLCLNYQISYLNETLEFLKKSL